MESMPIYIVTMKTEVDGFGEDLVKNDLISFKININRFNTKENEVYFFNLESRSYSFKYTS